MAFHYSVAFVLSCVVLAALPVYGQIVSFPCTTAMVTSFTPCLSFLSNSSGNGTTPSPNCCTALRSMMSNGTACLCVIATGGIPFQIPINSSVAMSLPRACNMAGVPLQCKAPSPPAAAPGPSATGAPSTSPSPSRTPKDAANVSPPTSPALAPVADGVPALIPPSATATPASNSARQTPVAPSASPSLSYGFSPLVVVAALVVSHFY